jgi:hypothetical protein
MYMGMIMDLMGVLVVALICPYTKKAITINGVMKRDGGMASIQTRWIAIVNITNKRPVLITGA